MTTDKTPPPAEETGRQASIDFLRFIAALMVATMHWGLEVGSERYADIYKIPVIGELVKNGGFGVDIFFVISGFVIIGTAQKYNAIEFIFARFNRLFPGLVISMLVVLIIGSKFINSYEQPFASFFHSIFLTYQVSGIQPLATPLWTLIIEVKFYFGVAIMLLLLPKCFRSPRGIVTLLILWEIIIIVLQETASHFGTFLLPYLTLNGWMKLFALGICFNLLSKIRLKMNLENILVWLISLYYLNEVFLIGGYSNILKLYLAIASILIIFSRRFVIHFMLQRIAYWLGLSSYLIYLLHEHLGMAIVLQLQSRVTSNIYVIIGITSLSITIVCALLAVSIEKPMQRFSKKQFQKIYVGS